MKTSDIIKKVVFKAIEKDQLFTSLDISQEIKKSGKFVRNVAVRNWLKDNFKRYVKEANNCTIFSDPNVPQKFSHYETRYIKVRGGTENATLYIPNWAKEEDYLSRDQVPMTPSEVRKTTVSKTVPANVPDISKLIDDDVDIVSRKIASLERLKIPGNITKKLGWVAGTIIDADKAKLIKTDKPLPAGLKVNKDLRISIPRGAIAVPNPVKVRCDGYVITFEKA